MPTFLISFLFFSPDRPVDHVGQYVHPSSYLPPMPKILRTEEDGIWKNRELRDAEWLCSEAEDSKGAAHHGYVVLPEGPHCSHPDYFIAAVLIGAGLFLQRHQY